MFSLSISWTFTDMLTDTQRSSQTHRQGYNDTEKLTDTHTDVLTDTQGSREGKTQKN